MIFDVLTLFPAMFDSPFQESILGRAIRQGLLEVHAHNLRDWAEGKHLTTDDSPYGGGAGMVMKPEPVARAIADLRRRTPESKVVLLTPQGKPFNQQRAQQLAQEEGLIFVCGRYEGFDERIRETLVDDEFSIGDFVLTGGELPAMVMIDAISRHLPGVLGSDGSAASDSFADGLLEYPQYTRPAVFNGVPVPEVLLSGNHGKIARWRREQQFVRTLQRRSELIEQLELTQADREILETVKRRLADDKVFTEDRAESDPSR